MIAINKSISKEDLELLVSNAINVDYIKLLVSGTIIISGIIMIGIIASLSHKEKKFSSDYNINEKFNINKNCKNINLDLDKYKDLSDFYDIINMSNHENSLLNQIFFYISYLEGLNKRIQKEIDGMKNPWFLRFKEEKNNNIIQMKKDVIIKNENVIKNLRKIKNLKDLSNIAQSPKVQKLKKNEENNLMYALDLNILNQSINSNEQILYSQFNDINQNNDERSFEEDNYQNKYLKYFCKFCGKMSKISQKMFIVSKEINELDKVNPKLKELDDNWSKIDNNFKELNNINKNIEEFDQKTIEKKTLLLEDLIEKCDFLEKDLDLITQNKNTL